MLQQGTAPRAEEFLQEARSQGLLDLHRHRGLSQLGDGRQRCDAREHSLASRKGQADGQDVVGRLRQGQTCASGQDLEEVGWGEPLAE